VTDVKSPGPPPDCVVILAEAERPAHTEAFDRTWGTRRIRDCDELRVADPVSVLVAQTADAFRVQPRVSRAETIDHGRAGRPQPVAPVILPA
jgi:hypothetical protein